MRNDETGMPNSPLGLVHVYTGDGKGKTTAALGVALRALGWGARVCVVQFIKGYSEIGEGKFAAELGERFVLKQFAADEGRGITVDKVMRRREAAEAALVCAEETLAGGAYDLVILDEINNAMHHGLVDKQRVIDMLDAKPERVEVILTGRNAPDDIIARADYVTEMRMVKHPFQAGKGARAGIDY